MHMFNQGGIFTKEVHVFILQAPFTQVFKEYNLAKQTQNGNVTYKSL